MKGKFYGIGVGPGDKELVTVKAVNVLGGIDVVVCPEKIKGHGSIAFETVKGYINKDARLVFAEFPMINDIASVLKSVGGNASVIAEEIKKGNDVAFLTLGDPSNYSTYNYIVPMMKEYGVEIETIPGITSYCAAACRLDESLAMWDESLCIYPLTKCSNEALDEILEKHDNIVILKVSRRRKMLGEKLLEKKLDNNFTLISRCGMEDESMHSDIDRLMNEEAPYLSVVIIKKRMNKLD